MANPEQIDRDERARAQFLAIKAKREANRVRMSDRKYDPNRRSSRMAQYTLKSVLGFADPMALGDAVRKHVLRNAARLDLESKTVIHVKNGKALTPEGKVLLARQIK